MTTKSLNCLVTALLVSVLVWHQPNAHGASHAPHGKEETSTSGGRIRSIHPSASKIVIGNTEYALSRSVRVSGLGPAPVGPERLARGLLVRVTFHTPPDGEQTPIIIAIHVLAE
ncbi:hypothetical protein [Aromatoleum anaerobium]|uniref:Uncharacterized protein n=1 Tax=Aromatoleum anaerobium TaxID=182180 RepID=A0ABX1PQU2_9RHOO|nr:hypothetical protein [Aromatoleum anaerobium]MCK0506289.1 hypothetical protein [Aromatoleum anaerobium]